MLQTHLDRILHAPLLPQVLNAAGGGRQDLLCPVFIGLQVRGQRREAGGGNQQGGAGDVQLLLLRRCCEDQKLLRKGGRE